MPLTVVKSTTGIKNSSDICKAEVAYESISD